MLMSPKQPKPKTIQANKQKHAATSSLIIFRVVTAIASNCSIFFHPVQCAGYRLIWNTAIFLRSRQRRKWKLFHPFCEYNRNALYHVHWPQGTRTTHNINRKMERNTTFWARKHSIPKIWHRISNIVGKTYRNCGRTLQTRTQFDSVFLCVIFLGENCAACCGLVVKCFDGVDQVTKINTDVITWIILDCRRLRSRRKICDSIWEFKVAKSLFRPVNTSQNALQWFNTLFKC